MYVKEVFLTNFRNYKEESVSFHEKVNIITGDNAQGKTNLLESLYLLSLGKSFRTGKDSEMIGFGLDFCRVKGITMKEDRDLAIEIAISKEGKVVKIDGIRAKKTADLLEQVYMVVFSPEDLKIVKEEPEKRRKFLDRELCQLKPVYYKNLSRYKKILQNRNILLRKGEVNPDLFAVYDEELAFYGTKIILERKRFTEKLNVISKKLHSNITNGKESLQIFYESDFDLNETEDEVLLREKMKSLLKSRFKKDLFRGTTGAGPHRDDLKLEVDGIDIRHFGSQGQQRTAALSLKLAEIDLIKEETGEDAILLLDDVLSELDVQRQTFLLNRLDRVQIFITAAEVGEILSANLPENFLFQVEKGSITRVQG